MNISYFNIFVLLDIFIISRVFSCYKVALNSWGGVQYKIRITESKVFSMEKAVGTYFKLFPREAVPIYSCTNSTFTHPSVVMGPPFPRNFTHFLAKKRSVLNIDYFDYQWGFTCPYIFLNHLHFLTFYFLCPFLQWGFSEIFKSLFCLLIWLAL